MPSTPFSSGTAVCAAAVLYSQFSDVYRPVPEPEPAYATASSTKVLASEEPAAAGAVPSTATLPVTADCQAVPIASVPEVAVVGVRVEQEPEVDGSPMISAA